MIETPNFFTQYHTSAYIIFQRFDENLKTGNGVGLGQNGNETEHEHLIGSNDFLQI